MNRQITMQVVLTSAVLICAAVSVTDNATTVFLTAVVVTGAHVVSACMWYRLVHIAQTTPKLNDAVDVSRLPFGDYTILACHGYGNGDFFEDIHALLENFEGTRFYVRGLRAEQVQTTNLEIVPEGSHHKRVRSASGQIRVPADEMS